MWMGIAYFVGSVVLIAVIWGFGIEKPENLLSPYNLLTVLRGFVWVLGMTAYNIAIDKIGLTCFNQWKNIQGPVGSILIMLCFAPVISGIKLVYLVLGIVVMFVSAWFFLVPQNIEYNANTNINTKKNMALGVSLAILSGVCFGVTAFLNSWVSRPALVGGDTFTFSQLLYHSASLMIFSGIAYLILGKKLGGSVKIDNKTWLPMIAGAMYMVATLLSIYSYRLISNNVIPWSITQLNVLWTVIIGVFIYKEVSFKQHWLRLIAGTVLAVGACVLLFLAI